MIGNVNALAPRRSTSPEVFVPPSTYQENFVRDNTKAPLLPDEVNNLTHKDRFVYGKKLPVTSTN
jgi:hypothetical protein